MTTIQSVIQKDISLKLYHYLCEELVGYEDVVRYRRLFFKVLDDIVEIKPADNNAQCISSGSRAEGLFLNGSDFDVMSVSKSQPVYVQEDLCIADFLDIEIKRVNEFTNVINISSKSIGEPNGRKICVNPLVMDTEHAAPGFALLVNPMNSGQSCGMFVETEHGQLLSNKAFKESYLHSSEEYNETEIPSIIHGPCLSDPEGLTDIAYCLKCEKWPKVANGWILRHRSSGWPTPDLIDLIKSEGVIFVPIGSKMSDSEEDNEFEWRLSFSVAEKILIHTFNHSQLVCYALLKIILKELINNNLIDGDKAICSYYMKTLMFWLLEETDEKMWRPDNLLHCFSSCIKRLTFWIRYDFLPNFFIPEHNMLEGKKSELERLKLLTALENIYSFGWVCFLHCDSLKHFIDISPRGIYLKNDSRHVILGKAWFPLLSDSISKRRNPTYETYSFLNSQANRCIFKVHLHKRWKSIKELLILLMAELHQEMIFYYRVDDYQGKDSQCNKRIYIHDRKVLYHILISTYSDSVSGWLLLAFYFMLRRQYLKCLFVLDHILSVSTMDKILISGEKKHSLKEIRRCRNSETKEMSFLQYIRKRTVRDLVILLNNGNIYSEATQLSHLQFLIGGTSIMFCQHAVFASYLQFLCYHLLNDIKGRQQSLQDLTCAVQNQFYMETDKISKTCLLSYLIEAFDLVGDYYTANEYRKVILSLI